MKNILEEIKTTIIGLLFFAFGFYTRAEFINTQPYVMFGLIAIGILLLFAKDEIPKIIQSLLNKFFK